jgi:hypothetical protein
MATMIVGIAAIPDDRLAGLSTVGNLLDVVEGCVPQGARKRTT